jgi:hypothetical protein
MSDQPEAPESTDGTHEGRGTTEENPTDRSANRRRPTGRDERDGSTGPSSSTGAGLLSGLVLGGVLGSAATGTASADSTGQVGTAGDPLTALYTAELNGPVTDAGSGPQAVTSLVGDGLTVESGALSAAPARPDVEDGSTSVSDAAELTFGQGLTVTDDGNGTATVGLDTRLRAGPKIHPNLRDVATRFGQSVALSGVGRTAIVGARTPDGGAAYVFAERGFNSFSWQTELTADDGDDGDRFGASVAVSDGGGTVVVGAPRDDDPNGSFAGSAYVFVEDGGGWSQQAKLTADDGDADDGFGRSVALSDDGTTALVGAYKDEDPNGAEAGSAYVFADDGSGTWTQQNKLAASDGALNDRFASDLSLSGDGSVALVGAPLDDNTNGEFAGSAYIFTEDVTGTLTQEDKLVAADAGNGDDRDQFGSSVSLSNDGTTALIGADRDEDPNGSFAGSAYVFADPNDDGTWTQQTKLSASDGDSSDGFGGSVSLSADGTTALVGARNAGVPDGPETGRAYVFVDDGGWSQQDTVFASDGGDNDRFGASVALSDNADTALVGAPTNVGPDTPSTGSGYVYRDNTGDGSFFASGTLTAVDGDAGDNFGSSVALSDDGTTALVGAAEDEDPNGDRAGSAYLFAEDGPGWTHLEKLAAARDGEPDRQDFFGASVALSADGTTALVGAPRDTDFGATRVGGAYVFAKDGGGWSQLDTLRGGGSDSELGSSVALSADGTTALVGAPRDETLNGNFTGSASVFVDDGTGTWNQLDTLVAGDIDDGDGLGRSVALSDDGTVALVGAPSDADPNGTAAGSVYVFADDGTGTWTQQDTFAAGDAGNGDDGDRFGTAVALSGDGTTALVGAPEDEDPNGQGAGSAYVFADDGTGTWSQQDKFAAGDGDDNDEFGDVVALSADGTTALVGAAFNDEPTGRGSGSAYTFADDGTGTWSQRTKLNAIDADDEDRFGRSVALVGNGTTALVGAPNDEDPNGAGSAYFFYETL